METGRDFICNGVGLAMLIPSVSIKDRTTAGTSIEIEHMPHLVGWITRFDREAK